MTTRILYSTAFLERLPPWLRRTVGAKLVRGIGDEIDAVVDRSVEAAKARFPNAARLDALGAIGVERRIRRGPNETAATYAKRLRRWFDDHRTRGGPYALLAQLFAYFAGFLDVRIDVVYWTGNRFWVAPLTGVVTHDSITWSTPPNGTSDWSQIWIVFHLGDLVPSPLVTQAGDIVITQSGDTLVMLTAPGDLSGGLSEAEREVFRIVVREWIAAHVSTATIVLLYGVAELWDYPQPVGIWDDGLGNTWDEQIPVVFNAES